MYATRDAHWSLIGCPNLIVCLASFQQELLLLQPQGASCWLAWLLLLQPLGAACWLAWLDLRPS